MQADNSFYGHSAILARYVGLTTVPPIWGILQHGFNMGAGIPAHYPRHIGLPAFLWNDRNARAATAAGLRHRIIGAPYLYLDLVLRDVADLAARAGTIAYPFHSWEKTSVEGDHADLAGQFAANCPRPLTVCLYWKEWRDPQVRSAYEPYADRVICHGGRYDPMFLVRLWFEQQRHAHVASNSVCTALFYGAATGCSVEVLGPVFRVLGDEDVVGWDAVQRRDWPELYDGGLGPSEAEEVGRRELGAAHLLPPAELENVLGWGLVRRSVAPAIRALVDTRRRVRGLERPPRAAALPQDLVAAATAPASP